MDTCLWEQVQILLSRDDLLNLRETWQFHAACEWFGPGWTLLFSRRWSTFSDDRLGTSFVVSAPWRQEETSFQHLATPAGRYGCVSSPNGRNGFATCRPTLGTQPPLVELSGQVGELAAELGVGWTREGYPPHCKKVSRR